MIRLFTVVRRLETGMHLRNKTVASQGGIRISSLIRKNCLLGETWVSSSLLVLTAEPFICSYISQC